jgi:isocitrate/isopropylmalate dehydrogenase
VAGSAIADLGPGKFALKVITETGTRRVARFAFELARRRRARGHPGKVTVSAKYNARPATDGGFVRGVREVAAEFPEIPLESFIVDDFARRMVAEPQVLDVVLLPNLYGDVLSDLAAGLIGGLGLAPSGCYGDGYAYFESVHGSAPDIAGKNVINPTATLLSGALLLEYLGFAQEAQALERAIERVYAAGKVLTPDQGGSASTTGFCEALARHL